MQKLIAARLAADVSNTPTILIARTDADAADLVTSDVDENDKPFLTGGELELLELKQDLIGYCKRPDILLILYGVTSKPDLEQAQTFAEAIKKDHPEIMLAYNCSPSFNWKKNLDDATMPNSKKNLVLWVISFSSSL